MLWLLRPVNGLPQVRDARLNPWRPWYDKAFGFVVRAPDDATARKLADAGAGDENRNDAHPWLDSQLSTCVPLTETGPTEVVLVDYRSA